MPREEIPIHSFSGGELSPDMYGRGDLAVYQNGARRIRNFVSSAQGPAVFRSGFRLSLHTRGFQPARLIRFEFNDVQAYQLELTEKKMRFHKDEAVIVKDAIAITSISQADPASVVTAAVHNLVTGDEVFIFDAEGMTEVNGRSYIVTVINTTTFTLDDIKGGNFDTTGFTAHTASTGEINQIYEIDTPYVESLNFFEISTAQNADTMYLVHHDYEPRKLTRTGHAAWTLSTFTRTNDPFLDKQVITNITQADPAVVTITGHPFVTGDEIIIDDVAGMTEINGHELYKVIKINANTFSLTDLDDVGIDSTGFSAYVSGGYASLHHVLPTTVEFYESRLFYGGSHERPDRIVGSRTPDSAGLSRYDDFTVGTDDDHAIEFTIADAEVNNILWMKGTDRLLLVGTFGTVTRVTGSETDLAITPTSIQARALDRIGVANADAINKENIVHYVQRGELKLQSFEFDALQDGFRATDQNLVSKHITESGIKELAWQTGYPNIVWAVRNDGVLIGMTYQAKEAIAGWHRHTTGANQEDKFTSVSNMPRPSGFDQLWVVVKRTIEGVVRHFVEFGEDHPTIPEEIDFFTGVDNKATDDLTFGRAMGEAQKQYMHLDSALTYDGSLVGSAAGATLTPAAITGTSVVFTASAAVFSASDVGRQLWKKAITGVGEGRATILTFNSSTEVVCNVIADFDNTDAMPSGEWYITTDTVTGLEHLEGRTVKGLLDGTAAEKTNVGADAVVTNGQVQFTFQASVIHVGLAYRGFLQPMSLEFAGETGTGYTKPRNIYKVGVRFHKTLGAAVGTSIYKEEVIRFATVPLVSGAPQSLFTGIKNVPYNDRWELDKNAYVRQENPLPCEVQFLAIYGETDND